MGDSGFHRVRALGGKFSALTGAEDHFRGYYSIHVLVLRVLPACGGARASLPKRCIARLHGAHTGSGGLRAKEDSAGQQYADLFPGKYRRQVDYLAHFHFVEDGPNRLDTQVTMIEGANSNLRLIHRRAVIFFNRADV